jgi:hypothetical protein
MSPEDVGLNIHTPWGYPPTSYVLDIIRSSNVTWVRMDFNWFEIEPVMGVRNLQAWHDDVDALLSSHPWNPVRIYATVGYTPQWANGGHPINWPPTTAVIGSSKDAEPITGVRKWKEFVAFLAQEFAGQIEYWSIWNEPDLEDYFHGSDSQYINQVLLPAVEAIHQVESSSNPPIDLKICAPDVSNDGIATTLYEVLQSSAGPDLDIVSFHAYSHQSPEQKASLVRWYVNQAGGSQPIWLTETGNDDEWTHQANVYEDLLQANVADKAFFFETMDVEGGPNGDGITWWDGATLHTKPALDALRHHCGENSAVYWSDTIPRHATPGQTIQGTIRFEYSLCYRRLLDPFCIVSQGSGIPLGVWIGYGETYEFPVTIPSSSTPGMRSYWLGVCECSEGVACYPSDVFDPVRVDIQVEFDTPGTLSGGVHVDHGTGLPFDTVEGAAITVGDHTAISDSLGDYSVEGIAPGTYEAACYHPLYGTSQAVVEIYSDTVTYRSFLYFGSQPINE